MIEGAVILSGVVRHWPDFFIILLLLVSNAVVGFWEEHQAGDAIAALRKQLAIKAKVKRDGKWTDPSAKEVVTGDVIRLRLGCLLYTSSGSKAWRRSASRSRRRRSDTSIAPTPLRRGSGWVTSSLTANARQ